MHITSNAGGRREVARGRSVEVKSGVLAFCDSRGYADPDPRQGRRNLLGAKLGFIYPSYPLGGHTQLWPQQFSSHQSPFPRGMEREWRSLSQSAARSKGKSVLLKSIPLHGDCCRGSRKCLALKISASVWPCLWGKAWFGMRGRGEGETLAY